MADALTKLYNTDRQRLEKKLIRHAKRYAWDNIVTRYVNPFLDECENILYPKYTSTGLTSWRKEHA